MIAGRLAQRLANRRALLLRPSALSAVLCLRRENILILGLTLIRY